MEQSTTENVELREGAPALDAAEVGLPEFFVELLKAQYGEEKAALVCEGCQADRAATLRANTLRATEAEVAAALAEAGIEADKVAWYADAFVLNCGLERQLWDMPLYKEGKVYLQSLSSMLPPLVMELAEGQDVLDMCAAPGGKTSEIAALGQGKLHVTACEMNVPRAEKLEYNLGKQGAKNVIILKQDARRLDDFFSFDRILVDAPCSGSGTVHAHDEKTFKRLTPQLVAKSKKSQKALLDKALKLLKPGGKLVYSTCSVLEEENEDIVRACLREANKKRKHGPSALYEVEEIVFDGIEELPLLPSTIEGALVLRPTERYEGFFMAKIKRVR